MTMNPPLPLVESIANRPVYEVLGQQYTLVLGANETGGAYSIFDQHVPPGVGVPPHIHAREDESFYVLSGQVNFTLDGKVHHAKAGDVVFGPRGISHSYTGAGDEDSHLLIVVSPGGFEEFFNQIGRRVANLRSPAAPPSDADIQRLLRVAPEFGIRML